MSKFKVGDKVRVIGNTEPLHWISIGTECVVICETGYKEGYGDVMIEGIDVDGRSWEQSVCLADIEPITKHRQLEVGGTYTSKNGNNWECIAVKGEIAWLVGVYSDGASGSAYSFNIDGTPICLMSAIDEYRIVFPPIIEVKHETVTVAGQPMTIRYEVIDGVANLDNATIAPF